MGKWPHALSPALACLGCTLGLFNISRFSILSVQFGGKDYFLNLNTKKGGKIGLQILLTARIIDTDLGNGSHSKFHKFPQFQKFLNDCSFCTTFKISIFL